MPTRLQMQVIRLNQLGIPAIFGYSENDFSTWLNQAGIDARSLASEGSYIIPPWEALDSGKRQECARKYCPHTWDKSDAPAVGRWLNQNHLTRNPYRLERVSFDQESCVAKMAVKNWPELQRELLEAGRVGLQIEEILALLAYGPQRFDSMLALGSLSVDGFVPCLRPSYGNRPAIVTWHLSFPKLVSLIDPETERWSIPLDGDCLVSAPTAKRIIVA